MQRDVFVIIVTAYKELLDWLRDIRVYEQVVMFLLTIGHHCHNFLVQDVFRHRAKK